MTDEKKANPYAREWKRKQLFSRLEFLISDFSRKTIGTHKGSIFPAQHWRIKCEISILSVNAFEFSDFGGKFWTDERRIEKKPRQRYENVKGIIFNERRFTIHLK